MLSLFLEYIQVSTNKVTRYCTVGSSYDELGWPSSNERAANCPRVPDPDTNSVEIAISPTLPPSLDPFGWPGSVLRAEPTPWHDGASQGRVTRSQRERHFGAELRRNYKIGFAGDVGRQPEAHTPALRLLRMSAGTLFRNWLTEELGRYAGRAIARTMWASLCSSGKPESPTTTDLCGETKAARDDGAQGRN